MDNLRWNDIQMHEDGVVLTVRKGKTTLYTGDRHVVGNRAVLDMMLDMHEGSHDGRDPDYDFSVDGNPLVFRLPDGSTTVELTRNFTVLLRRLKLEEGAGGKRTLYSLRHTYITNLILDRLPIDVIAKQCGTSTAMIEAHYSHITPLMYSKELAGIVVETISSLVAPAVRKLSL